MIKKISILLVFGFLFLNFFSIKNFSFNVYWNNLFEKKWYIDAEKNFSKSKNIFWAYNKANSLYKQWKFSNAAKEYFSILSEDKNEMNFNLNHNIWNSYYRIWEKSEKTEEKKAYREKSVEYYEKALDVKYNEETKKNLEFVLNKIKKLWEDKNKKEENKDKKNQNNSKNSDSKNGKKSWEKEKKWDKEGQKNNQESWKKNWTWNKSKDTKSKDWDKKNGEKGKKWSDWKPWEKSKNQNWQSWKEDSWISKEQEEALKQYEKSLKNTQKQANKYFNKVYQENNSNDPFDSFFQNDPFFNNWDLKWWKEKKDW